MSESKKLQCASFLCGVLAAYLVPAIVWVAAQNPAPSEPMWAEILMGWGLLMLVVVAFIAVWIGLFLEPLDYWGKPRLTSLDEHTRGK